MCCSTLKIGKILLIFGIYLLQLGKKHTFLALGTIPVTGVGFIARKITGIPPNIKKRPNLMVFLKKMQVE